MCTSTSRRVPGTVSERSAGTSSPRTVTTAVTPISGETQVPDSPSRIVSRRRPRVARRPAATRHRMTKGTAPAYLDDLLFDTLLIGSLDEAGSAYGLLAEDVEVAPDRLSATFRLRPQARFHNGDPVLAADVKHSFDTLTGPHARPTYATLMADVAGADALDERTVHFRFKKPSRELPCA